MKVALSKFPIKSKVYRSKARNAGSFKETELKEVNNTIINDLEEYTNKYPKRVETFNSEICHKRYWRARLQDSSWKVTAKTKSILFWNKID